MKIVPCNVVLRKIDGTELDIVNAARVSFHKESGWAQDSDGHIEGRLQERDVKLINYLASHGHWTPFGHVNATFVIKAPLFVARQLGKHQVGLVWNEVSRRYVSDEPEFFIPETWRSAPGADKKQGSGLETYAVDAWGSPQSWIGHCLDYYKTLLANNVAPEQARMVLPQNMMTEWWWTGSLAAWARVFKLRLDPHTQQETREVAAAMYDQLLPSFPNALPALLKE